MAESSTPEQVHDPVAVLLLRRRLRRRRSRAARLGRNAAAEARHGARRHTALRQASVTREQLDPPDAERLGAELRAVDAELTQLRGDNPPSIGRTVHISDENGRLTLTF